MKKLNYEIVVNLIFSAFLHSPFHLWIGISMHVMDGLVQGEEVKKKRRKKLNEFCGLFNFSLVAFGSGCVSRYCVT